MSTVNFIEEDKITQPYTKKFGVLLVNKIICDLEKVTKSAPNQKLSTGADLGKLLGGGDIWVRGRNGARGARKFFFHPPLNDISPPPGDMI